MRIHSRRASGMVRPALLTMRPSTQVWLWPELTIFGRHAITS